jgi:hypothetical protein
MVRVLQANPELAESKPDQPLTVLQKNLQKVGRWLAAGQPKDRRSLPKLTPHSYEAFWDILINKGGMQIRIEKAPHPCPRCNSHATNVVEEEELAKKLEAATSMEERKDLQEKLKKVGEKIRDHARHVLQLRLQKQFVRELEEGLGTNEIVMYRDFVGMHSLEGKKFYDLVFVIVSRDQFSGLTETRFLDLFTCGKHDSQCVYSALRFLLQNTQELKGVKKIYLSGDNGSHFNNYQLAYFLSTIWSQYGVEVEVHNLPPHHAWSQCDSHGGTVKQALWAAQCATQSFR